MGREREALGVGPVVHERSHRPGFDEAAHLLHEFLHVLFVSRLGIGTRQRLPVQRAVQAPLVVPGVTCGRIEVPVDRTIELVAEYVVLHGLFRLDEHLFVVAMHIALLEKIDRVRAGAEMGDDLADGFFQPAGLVALGRFG